MSATPAVLNTSAARADLTISTVDGCSTFREKPSPHSSAPSLQLTLLRGHHHPGHRDKATATRTTLFLPCALAVSTFHAAP